MKTLKHELWYVYLSLVRYRRPFAYVYWRFIYAPRIYRTNEVLDRAPVNSELSMHVLTCHRDILITLWSLASFYKVFRKPGQLYIHDDGTLNPGDKAILAKLFPHAKIVSTQSFSEEYATELARLPEIAAFRRSFTKFQSKKLLDTYFVGPATYHLVIDTDLIWFASPTELEELIASNRVAALMPTNGPGEYCYVYYDDTRRITEEEASYNSGIVLYHREAFDLGKVTSYLGAMNPQSPAYRQSEHFLEQAAFAHALRQLEPLSEERYIIKGAITPAVVVRHFTSPSRAKFYLSGLPALSWKI